MLKLSSLAALLASAMLLSACSKHTAPEAPKAQSAAQAAPDEATAPRAATYDPNLKPAQIVWDSPEKKAQWEARQAQLTQAAAAQPAGIPARQQLEQTQPVEQAPMVPAAPSAN